jgi:N4-gp56 family major capsid protein
MAMNGTSTANGNNSLANEVAVYYERRFLERARAMLVHQEGGQLRALEGNAGKQVIFNRFSPLSLATTSLTEGVNPTTVNLTDTQVTVTLAEYGNSVQVTRLLGTVDIDDRDKEKIDVVAQNMGETLDALVRNALQSGASIINANGAITANLIAQTVATLKENKALMYPGTFGWIGKIQPESEYDLIITTTWQNAAAYSNVQALYAGEIGALYGVRFLVSNQGYVTAGTTPYYANFIHGREAFGVYDNQLDPPKMYIVTGADSNNPAERFHVISWAGQFAATVLNSTWVINLVTSSAIS